MTDNATHQAAILVLSTAPILPNAIKTCFITVSRRALTFTRQPLTLHAFNLTHIPMSKHDQPYKYEPMAFLPRLIFASRWLQLPLYLGLIVAQAVYVFLFMKELWHLITHATEWGELEIMLMVLGLIDVVMISNLLVMVIVGGYETFVSRLRLEGHPDQPEWLSHVNASVLKVKLAMAIIGISSIHLLKTFIAIGNLGAEGSPYTAQGVLWQTIIHCVFILSAIGIAWTDKLMMSASSKHH